MLILEQSKCCHMYRLSFILCIFTLKIITCNSLETYKPLQLDPDPAQGNNYKPTSTPLQNEKREGKDLVYEAMKMRTGVWPPQGKNLDKVVGGGLLEKQLLNSPIFSQARENPDVAIRFESREMQCCDKLSLESVGGVVECHPYVLGHYRKIGECNGRSFYQHNNNTDIFFYHACGAWYVGLQIGVCGGWLVAKSLQICASATHEGPWEFFNQGVLHQDVTFHIKEWCQFNEDFRPIPIKPTSPTPLVTTTGIAIHHLGHTPSSLLTAQPTRPFDQSTSFFSTTTPIPQSVGSKPDVKHEHIHYHFQAGEKKIHDSSHNHATVKPKPVNPSYAIVNYLEDGRSYAQGSGSSGYQPQAFQDRRGTYSNNNNADSSPSLVYSKVVKIEGKSPYAHPNYLYRNDDPNMKLGKQTENGIELPAEVENGTSSTASPTTTKKSNFYFPVSSKREEGKVETKLVTPELGGKFIFTDTFPFFKRVARLDDSIQSKQEKLGNEHSSGANDEDRTKNQSKSGTTMDKNSRRIL